MLVSAAAGSGKTAILIERILRIILEGKANVDELLVVTFTKAAASEMKLRLSSAIRKRMREEPSDVPRLREQLSRLYRAYITTIDSFALRVIREFFYLTDGEPDFKACDEVQGEMMRREALTELFEAGFEDDHFLDIGNEEEHSDEIKEAVSSVGFREFLRLYSEERQDETFKEKLLDSYSRLRTMPDYFAWAYSRAEDLLVSKDNFEGSALQSALLKDAVLSFKRACLASEKVRELFELAGIEDVYEDKLSAEDSALHELLDEALHGRLDEDILRRAGSVSYVTLRSSKGWKEAYEPIKEEVKSLREIYKKEMKGLALKYTSPDLDTRLLEMNETYRYTVYYIRLLEVFERRYAAKKAERHVLDFSDMEHIAVRILRDEEAAGALRKRFHYIFVDEYQDTNRIQEELISSVARPDNVFRVGDIKQSIYKFRQAEPEIFKSVYDSFSRPENTAGTVIDLGMNFRSNDATIRYINHVFSNIMEGYDKRARLYTGTACEPEYDFIPEVHILTSEGMPEDERPSDAAQPAEEEMPASGEDIDDEIESLSKEEAEADYIASLAADLIGTEFMDTKTGEKRKAEAKDIVILFRAVKMRGEIMSAALRKRGIEPHVEESDDYFDTVEIGIAMSLLSCIDNTKRDVPLIATLHSAIFGLSASELAMIRIAHTEHVRESRSRDKNSTYIRPAFWEAFKWYCEEGPEGELRTKTLHAQDKLREWKRLSNMMPLDDFVWHVLVDSGCYRMTGAMHGGARRQNNLRALVDRAGKYRSESVGSLGSYIRFIDIMRQKGIKSSQTPAAAGDDVIRISTIHKSKGLEYPFVIIGGLGHQFRKVHSSKSLSIDSSLGIGLPYIDPSRKYWRSTLIQRAISAKAGKDSYDEELRILYVAMTRARNKLIMTGVCTSEDKLAEYTANPDCYLKVMRDVVKTPYNTYFVSPLSSSGQGNDIWNNKVPDPSDIVLTAEEEAIYDEIEHRFGYEYPDSWMLSSKAKYSVSELRRMSLENKSSLPEIMRDEDENAAENAAEASRRRRKKNKNVSAADIGTAYHRIIEFTDFTRAVTIDGGVDEKYIRERAEVLAEKGAIDEDVFREVDLARAADFFRSGIGRRAAEAARRGSLMKEKAFTLRTRMRGGEDPVDTGGSTAGEAGERSVLVQGVIDCCFEENGRMVLVDYKSNYIRQRISHEAELERIKHEYRMQIELYSEAISAGTGLDVGEAYLYLFSSGEEIMI